MGIRILLIEDEEQIADFVVRGLREEGFSVEHAGDGEDGWHALRTGTWDVVLLDWWLPGTDGLALLKPLRQTGRDTPVLFLTARDTVSDRVRGLDNGADDYPSRLIRAPAALHGRRLSPVANSVDRHSWTDRSRFAQSALAGGLPADASFGPGPGSVLAPNCGNAAFPGPRRCGGQAPQSRNR